MWVGLDQAGLPAEIGHFEHEVGLKQWVVGWVPRYRMMHMQIYTTPSEYSTINPGMKMKRQNFISDKTCAEFL